MRDFWKPFCRSLIIRCLIRSRESKPAIVNRSQGYTRKEDDADDGCGYLHPVAISALGFAGIYRHLVLVMFLNKLIPTISRRRWTGLRNNLNEQDNDKHE